MEQKIYEEKLAAIKEVLSLEEDAKVAVMYVKRIVMGSQLPVKNHSKYTLKDIEKQIIEHLGITPEQIRIKTRKRETVLARQMAHFKSVRFTWHTLSAIGSYFGEKDHATVLHSVRSINNLLDTDYEFCEQHEEFLKN
ncbi:MAG: helix-turn-helix domain-containing protein [Bacteroidota bacterium]|nr:helix-turn-helix domain-containing protein [Bacteroidota bacterium]